MTRSLDVPDRQGQIVKSPIANPFMNNDYLQALQHHLRADDCLQARDVPPDHAESRSWLPDPIGGVVWLGYDNPVTTPHTPFYVGITSMPASYMVDGRAKFRRDCAWWAFRQPSQLAYLRWQVMVKDIEKVWRPIEEKAFADQARIEAEALALYKPGSRKGARVPDEVLARRCDRRGRRRTGSWPTISG